ncbi:MAG TPA: ABC transporter permease [Chloroflexota bacterium]|nr:ABC transporter permease [Chloroflexota bacterium]HZU04368.1 ABC transporter permease [Chloroflexota bacterium]
MRSRILALLVKEFIQIRRDPRTLAMVLVMPVVQLLLFGYVVNTTVEHLPTIVLDQAGDRASRALIQALHNSGIFDVVATARDRNEVHRAVDTGDARVGLIIPPDFSRAQTAGRSAEVQVLIDGSDPNVAQAALYAVVAVGQMQTAEALATRLQRLGVNVGNGMIEVRPLVLYNPQMLSVNFMIPGLIGLILQNSTLILTAFAIVRERERGTLEQLIVTPLRSWELMLGKLLPYALLAFINVTVALTIGALWFKVEIAGSVPLLLVLSVVFLLNSLGLGLLISTVSQTQGQAVQMASFVLLPAVLLSGFMFPRETMPLPLHDLGYLIPLTYFLKILRGIILKGVGLDILWWDVVPMALLGGLLFTLSALRFRKQLA